MSASLSSIVGRGALAGAVAGVAGAAAMAVLVEPSIREAIRIEESMEVHGGHESVATTLHAHGGDAVVSRPEQVVLGLVTVLVVGVLIGVAFAVVHRVVAARLPARTTVGTVLALAALGFVTFTLAPAVVVPSNPPAVGDPATVGTRTTVYLATIVCAVALTILVLGVSRNERLGPGARVAGASALGVVGAGVLILALPDVEGSVPSYVPADLIWDFRVASLAQVGLMWLVLSVVYAVVAARAERSERTSTSSVVW